MNKSLVKYIVILVCGLSILASGRVILQARVSLMEETEQIDFSALRKKPKQQSIFLSPPPGEYKTGIIVTFKGKGPYQIKDAGGKWKLIQNRCPGEGFNCIYVNHSEDFFVRQFGSNHETLASYKILPDQMDTRLLGRNLDEEVTECSYNASEGLWGRIRFRDPDNRYIFLLFSIPKVVAGKKIQTHGYFNGLVASASQRLTPNYPDDYLATENCHINIQSFDPGATTRGTLSCEYQSSSVSAPKIYDSVLSLEKLSWQCDRWKDFLH